MLVTVVRAVVHHTNSSLVTSRKEVHQVGTDTMENSMEIPQKTKNRATILSSNATPGYISGKNSNSKRYMHPNVQSSTINNNQDMEAT